MDAVKLFLLTLLLGAQVMHYTAEVTESTSSNDSARLAQDSYLSAYANTRSGETKSVVYATIPNQEVKKVAQPNKVIKPVVSNNKPIISNKPVVKFPPVRREDSYATGPNAEPTSFSSFSSGGASNYNGYQNSYDNSYTDSYLPQNKYQQYGAPNNVKSTYGPPEHYAPSTYGYGPTAPTYGPPLKPVYGVPYGIPSFFDRIKLKLDLLTIAKIILKLIIFKKIIKFIAVICLLLFIPKLIHIKKGKDDEDDDDEDRKLKFNAEGRTDQALNVMYAFVQNAIETYNQQQKGCEDIGCRMKNVLDKVDEEYAFSSMVHMFNGNENEN